ncbi:hypothetical protein [Gilvibacter sp.]|jgi:hypothetical protein|uniref:hypothetical protein n=1 Tax=Gilvibacter sp. TaxID=2729997 RepID=UPI003B52E392
MQLTNPFKKRVFILLALGLCLQSCYSVRFVSINGDEQPDPLSTRTDYYRDMQVVELDTVITAKATTQDINYLIKESSACKSGRLHTVEVRNTFGAILLSAVTFGRKRKVKIKYVCQLETN